MQGIKAKVFFPFEGTFGKPDATFAYYMQKYLLIGII